MIGFFSLLFQSRKQKKELEAFLLQKSSDLLKELEQKWSTSTGERIDLVDYTNLLLQNAIVLIQEKILIDMFLNAFRTLFIHFQALSERILNFP